MRDYSTLALATIYLLQIIDANVFAYMHDFEIVDDLATVSIAPTVITPDTQLAFNPAPAVGLGLSIRF